MWFEFARISWMRNVLSEVLRANVMAKAGADADLLRQNLKPVKPPAIPEGLELEIDSD